MLKTLEAAIVAAKRKYKKYKVPILVISFGAYFKTYTRSQEGEFNDGVAVGEWDGGMWLPKKGRI